MSIKRMFSKPFDIDISGIKFSIYGIGLLSQNAVRLIRLLPTNLNGEIIMESKIFGESILMDVDSKEKIITVVYNGYCRKNNNIPIVNIDKAYHQKVLGTLGK